MNDWKPEVGQKCEVFDVVMQKWKPVKINAEGTTHYLASFYTGEVALLKTCRFRPNQPEADKMREKQIESMGLIASKDKTDNPTTKGRHLYEAGCRMTRPLTDEVIHELWQGQELVKDSLIYKYAKAIAAYVTGEEL